MATCPKCNQEKPMLAERCPHCTADVPLGDQVSFSVMEWIIGIFVIMVIFSVLFG